MSKILLILLTLVIVGGGLYMGITTWLNSRNDDEKPQTLTMWGIKEDPAIMAKVLEGYKKRHPNVTVNYSTQTLQNYRTRVQTQIAGGQSADIVAVHNSWMPMFYQAGSLSPAPAEILDSTSFNNLFYKVVGESFISGGKVYGIPTEIDGLALLINADILKGQNIGLPKTWDDVVNYSIATTVADQKGVIQTGGLGFGNTKNVDYWNEIIALLFLQQPGAQISQPDSAAGKEVIQFFGNPSGVQQKKLWNENMDSTTKAFREGKLAFYLAPAYGVKAIRSSDPQLNMIVMPVPQLPDKQAAYSCFWGYGVSAKSKNQKAAWQFLKFLTDAETERFINEEETKLYGMGRPYPRKDLRNEQEADPYLGAFVKQADLYKSFPLCSGTQDNGLNDQMIEAFKKAVDSADLAQLQVDIGKILTSFTTPSQ